MDIVGFFVDPMAYGFMPNPYQIIGGLVALAGVVYMQGRKLAASRSA